jgi:dihydroneopterin aldolase
MTRLLASVSTPEEADIALAGGADVIDLKAATPDIARAVVAAVGGCRAVCAGNPLAPLDPAEIRELAATGIDYLRIGMVPGVDAHALIRELPPGAKKIAVFAADAPPDLSQLVDSGFAGAIIDTAPASLLSKIDIAHLLGFVEVCHSLGLLAGLAGALETPDIPRLLVLTPDLLGFDTALRNPGGLDPARLRAVRALIPPESPAVDRPEVDYRLLTGRGHQATASDDAPVDLIFVQDLILPVFIGAYARERDTPQNVRFAVIASVIRTGRAAEDMRDVFSYDLITDGIRMLTGSGHVTFVETLAERISAMVLGHPRVTKVVVRVEKLETGAGTVGIEIERKRAAVRALDRPKLSLGGV